MNASSRLFLNSNVDFGSLKNELTSEKSLTMTHSELEKLVKTKGFHLLKILIEEHLQYRCQNSEIDKVLSSDGIELSYKKWSTRHIVTVFGKIKIKRLGFYRPGHKSLYPLDAQLNLPEEIYSLGIRKIIAFEASKNSFESAIESIKQYYDLNIPKRIAEDLTQKAAIDFDEFYKNLKNSAKNDEKKELPLIVLSTDGKGIVVRKEDLREATKKKAEVSNDKKKRLAKGEKKNRKRMATVAAVYEIDKFKRNTSDIINEIDRTKTYEKRPKPKNKRVWASLEQTQDEVIESMLHNAKARVRSKSQKWCCLVDGNKAQLKIIRKHAKKNDIELTIILDLIHVIEYLWKAAYVFHSEGTKEAEKWVSVRLKSILDGNASSVAAGMRRSATMLKVKKTQRAPVDTCAQYLLNYKEYLKYNEYLKKGMPIATGVIEGACRHLIKDRMDITGARWSLAGAEAILKLRSIRVSGDFEEYWKFHEDQELKRNHCRLYATPESILPDPVLRRLI